MYYFINMTPHEVTLVGEDDTIQAIPPSGIVLRRTSTVEHVSTVDGVRLYRERLTDVSREDVQNALLDAPADADAIVLIVSRVCADAPGLVETAEEFTRRHGTIVLVTVPATGQAIRDSEGRIVGVPGLVVVHQT